MFQIQSALPASSSVISVASSGTKRTVRRRMAGLPFGLSCVVVLEALELEPRAGLDAGQSIGTGAHGRACVASAPTRSR